MFQSFLLFVMIGSLIYRLPENTDFMIERGRACEGKSSLSDKQLIVSLPFSIGELYRQMNTLKVSSIMCF